MSASNGQIPDKAPIPEAARAALRRRGDRLLSELGSMRENDDNHLAIEPLDPQAELALRRGGDELIARLDSGRVALAAASSPVKRRWNWRHWSVAGAALVALALVILLQSPSASPSPAEPQITQLPPATAVGDPWSVSPITSPITSPAIPEPSSALLALISGVILLGRRRRP